MYVQRTGIVNCVCEVSVSLLKMNVVGHCELVDRRRAEHSTQGEGSRV